MIYFRRFWLGVILGVMSIGFSSAAEYTIDQAHSDIGFKIRHLVSNTKGRFDAFSGNVTFDQNKLGKTEANVTIETKSLNSNNEKRDTHLRSEDFFNVEKYPTMTFESTRAKKTGKSTFELTGDLTLLGVTKPVKLECEFLGAGPDPWGNSRAGFSATGTLNRKDYGMEYNITDKGGLVIGDEVTILIELETIKK